VLNQKEVKRLEEREDEWRRKLQKLEEDWTKKFGKKEEEWKKKKNGRKAERFEEIKRKVHWMKRNQRLYSRN
jgi:hypothetical protein